MKIVPGLDQDLLIIDLSGDFRIADSKTFEEFYHLPPPSPQEQKSFVYGLTELKREEIRSARRVANPGCFASAHTAGPFIRFLRRTGSKDPSLWIPKRVPRERETLRAPPPIIPGVVIACSPTSPLPTSIYPRSHSF